MLYTERTFSYYKRHSLGGTRVLGDCALFFCKILKTFINMTKFIIEVEEGCTLCEQCPFADSEVCEGVFEDLFICDKYDLSDLKITKLLDK